jgi:DNA-binding PadR family transcriptional regulator
MSLEEIEALEENSDGRIVPSLTEKGKEKLSEIREYWDYLPRHIRSLCKTDHLRRRVVENLESIPYQTPHERPQRRGIPITKLLRNDTYLTPNQKKDVSKKLEKIIDSWSSAKEQIHDWCDQEIGTEIEEENENNIQFRRKAKLYALSINTEEIYEDLDKMLPVFQSVLSREKVTYGSLIEPKRTLDGILRKNTTFARRCGHLKKDRHPTRMDEFEINWYKSGYRESLVKTLRDLRDTMDHAFDRQTASVNKLTLRMYADKGYISITKGRKRYPGITVKDSLDLDKTPFYKLKIKPGPNLSKLEVMGDVCPMGLSDKWETWKILYDPLVTSAAKYYQHEDNLTRVEFNTANQFFFESKDDYWLLSIDEAKDFLSKAENIMPHLTLDEPFFRNWMLPKKHSQIIDIDGEKHLKLNMSYKPKTLSLGIYYPLKQLLEYRKKYLE